MFLISVECLLAAVDYHVSGALQVTVPSLGSVDANCIILYCLRHGMFPK